MWTGHVVRMDENELPENILWTNPGSERGRGRPKSIWTVVKEEARKQGGKNCLAAAKGRGRWPHFLEEAKAHREL